MRYSTALRCTLLCLSLSLGACSSLKDTAEPPTELTDIKEEVRFDKVWQRDTGKGSGRYLLSLKPAFDEQFVYTVDYRGSLSAFDKKTGKKQWGEKLGVAISAAAGVGVDAIYLGSRDGELIAVSKQDGSIQWRTTLTGEVLAAPAVSVGMVVVHTADGAIHGLSEGTGEIQWSNRRNVPKLSLRASSQPIIDRGMVLVGMDNGRLMALSIIDGRVAWEAPLGVPQGRTELQRMRDVDVLPALRNDRVYAAAYQGRVAAIGVDTGRPIWSRDISAFQSLGAAEALFVNDENSQLWSLDESNGATLWTQDKLRARGLTSPTITGDKLIVGDFEGYLHVLSTADGRLLGRHRYDDEAYLNAVVVDGDLLYSLDISGELTAFRLEPAS